MAPSGDRRSGDIDKRSAPRSLATRKVYVANGRQVSKCSLIDIAAGGARIATTGLEALPEETILVDGSARRVHLSRIVWRSDHEAGLQFLASDTFEGPAGGLTGALEIATRFAWRLDNR